MAWQGLNKITGYKQSKKSVDVKDKAAFAEELNTFYARFDTVDYSDKHDNIRIDSGVSECNCDFSEGEIRSVFKGLIKQKAPGPDGLSPTVLKLCTDELAPVFKFIFDNTVIHHNIPLIWKMSAVVPVPKKSVPKQMNDYRPVALTPVPMKCLEKLVLKEIVKFTKPQMDQHQFAYQPKLGVEDAVLTLLHKTSAHLEDKNTYSRVMFIDFSSAFNTLQPHVIVKTLQELNVPDKWCYWILEFLTNRKQYVRVENVVSSMCTTNTGASQGCVLSPMLFVIYTNSFTNSQPGCTIYNLQIR